MDRERFQRKLTLTLLGYVLVPSAVIGIGLWGEGIRPAILDLSGLSMFPAGSIAVLAVLAGVIFALVPAAGSADETTSERDEDTPGARLGQSGLIVVGVIALLAGAIASVTGEFTTYTVLFWLCVPYGAGIVSVYELARTGRPTGDSTAN